MHTCCLLPLAIPRINKGMWTEICNQGTICRVLEEEKFVHGICFS